jgi:hypothetical protein
MTIQDKLNNPSPEDPFEPDIAAVWDPCLNLDSRCSQPFTAAQERRDQVPCYGQGVDQEVSLPVILYNRLTHARTDIRYAM